MFYGWTGGKQARCPGNAFHGVGAGAASWAYVYYNASASRIAVLLLNGRLASSADKTTEPKAAAAAASLYCNA